MFDCYVCQHCGHLQRDYTRFCPGCNGEKSLKFRENLLLHHLLINLISMTTQEDLDIACNASLGHGVSREFLTTTLAKIIVGD